MLLGINVLILEILEQVCGHKDHELQQASRWGSKFCSADVIEHKSQKLTLLLLCLGDRGL